LPKYEKKFVLLQVRSSSKRPPNKCLYPILGKPNILLLYKRILSKRYKTIIFTSNHKTDDYLVNLLKKNGIPFFRGSLENVYNRFIKCCKNFDDNDVVVRLTADLLIIFYPCLDLFSSAVKVTLQ
jgi:spore coat polysaccharide biosynthesis protein SpsF